VKIAAGPAISIATEYVNGTLPPHQKRYCIVFDGTQRQGGCTFGPLLLAQLRPC
jgi:hypothetical protein